MGCGCGKQNVQDTSKLVPKGIQPIVVQAVQPQEINYTIEQLIRVKDYLSSNNRNEIERVFVQQFMLEHSGLHVPDYCDQICMKNIRLKVEEMEVRVK